MGRRNNNFLIFPYLKKYFDSGNIFTLSSSGLHLLRADVSKYRPEGYKTEKSKILKKIHKVALGKLLT